MRLTAQTDFGLRIMMFAAARKPHRFTVAEVAEAFGLSRNHVMKIVQKLAGAGLLTSLRGRGGGLSISPKGEDSRLGALVRLLEEDVAPAVCFSPDGHCRVLGLCRLRPALAKAVDAFFEALDGYTLGDIALQAPEAQRLLDIALLTQARRVSGA